jgi:hypothetical protein
MPPTSPEWISNGRQGERMSNYVERRGIVGAKESAARLFVSLVLPPPGALRAPTSPLQGEV